MSRFNPVIRDSLVIILLFFLIVFSISKLIEIANPSQLKSDSIAVNKMNNINKLLEDPRYLTLKYIGNNPEAMAYVPKQLLEDRYVESLSEKEQDTLVRLKLLEDKIQILQNTLEKQKPSMVFDLWTYIWSGIIWLASIVISRYINHKMDYFLQTNKI